MFRQRAAFRATLHETALRLYDNTEGGPIVVTFLADRAPVALRPRLADTTAVKDQRVGCARPARFRHRGAELLFDDCGVIRLRDPDSVRDAEHMTRVLERGGFRVLRSEWRPSFFRGLRSVEKVAGPRLDLFRYRLCVLAQSV